MKMKNLTKRVFALILALILALTPVLTAPVTAEAATDDFYRILHLDCGRKYYTADWIKALITEMAAAGYTHLELAFGNDGLRFLLDDMSVGAYSDSAVTSAVQSGNQSYNSRKSYSTDTNELTQTEMNEIIAHAKTKGIGIIPLFNNPGHMYTMISAMTTLGMTPSYNGSASTMDLEDTDAMAFMKELLQKYFTYFADKGCTVFNIGADEYANDQYSGGSMGFGQLMNTGKYQLFVDYVNELNAMIKAKGMKTMAFNDGIYFLNSSYDFDTDIIVSFWSSGWSSYYSKSASAMAAMGHPMINTHGDYYYILGANDAYTPGTATYHADGYHTAASSFSNTSFMSSTVSDPAGSMFCVWADYPGAETEAEVAKYIRPIMRVMGARMQNSSSYDVDTIVAGGFNADGSINTDEPAPEDVSITDTATNVTVTAAGLTGLTVSQATAPSIENAADAKAWSIVPTTDEGVYTGEVTVSVPVPTGWSNVRGGVLASAYGEEVMGIEGTIANGYFTFVAPHLPTVVIYDLDTRVLVEVEKGQSVTKTDTTGNYASSYTGEGLDQTIATVEVTGVNGVSETTVNTTKATALEAGATYIIRVYDTSYALSANTGRTDWGTSTLAFESNTLTANTAHMWTLEASGNGYKLKNSAGYLNLGTGNNTAYLNSTGEVFNITNTSTGWTIGNGSVYVNALGGLSWYYTAGGWTADSTRFDFYKVTEKTDGYTEITFTGVSSGTTQVVVGNTTYKIVVEGGCSHDYVATTQEATCEQAGSTTYTCSLCGESYTEEIPALGHNYETVTVDATCEAAGSVTTTCANCGDETMEVIPSLGHDYETVTVDATCETAGSVTTTCANCGDETVETIPALGHDYESVVTAPTCDKAGATTYTCANCGDSYAEEIAALGHTYESETVEADCTTDGGTVYTCTACGHSYIAGKVEAYGHDYKTVTVDATCEAAGSVTTTCANCGDKTVETIPALGHTYETVTVEATCETAGSVSKACSVCGDETVETIPALGHDYKTTTVDATCEAAGSVTTACANCGDKTVEVIPALGHDYNTTTVEATCETDGSVTTACANCGDKTMEVIPALGHDITTTTVAATCETAGSVTTTCANCGETTVETIAALGHDYETVTVEATCETAGSVTKTCATCGDETVETIPALGHDYKTTTVDATCEAAGSVTTTCATCGGKTVETIAALGHNYQTVTVDATCENDGSVTTACANCGDESVEVIPALGHNYSSVTVSATCTSGGYIYHSCSNCGNSYTSDQTAALGHSYNAVQDGNNMVYTCATCGDTYTESLAVSYTYDKVSVFTADENYVITLYSSGKYYAVTHANNTLSVQQVTVSGNQITPEITEDMLWTYNSGKLSYTSGSTTFYLYAKSSSGWGGWFGSATLSLSTTNSSTVTLSSNRLKVGSYYLRYSSGKASLSRSATTTYLYQQNEE